MPKAMQNGLDGNERPRASSTKQSKSTVHEIEPACSPGSSPRPLEDDAPVSSDQNSRNHGSSDHGSSDQGTRDLIRELIRNIAVPELLRRHKKSGSPGSAQAVVQSVAQSANLPVRWRFDPVFDENDFDDPNVNKADFATRVRHPLPPVRGGRPPLLPH